MCFRGRWGGRTLYNPVKRVVNRLIYVQDGRLVEVEPHGLVAQYPVHVGCPGRAEDGLVGGSPRCKSVSGDIVLWVLVDTPWHNGVELGRIDVCAIFTRRPGRVSGQVGPGAVVSSNCGSFIDDGSRGEARDAEESTVRCGLGADPVVLGCIVFSFDDNGISLACNERC